MALGKDTVHSILYCEYYISGKKALDDSNLLLSDRETELCNTLFAIAKTLAEILLKLNIEFQDILHWFKINWLVANPGKFQVMFLGRFELISIAYIYISIGNIKVKVKNQVKLIGICIDDKLPRISPYI